MSPAGGVRVARSLLGLALGAGVCYCVYRVISAGDRKRHVTGGSILEKVSGMPVLASGQEKRPVQSENIPKSASNLEAHHIKTLLQILSTNSNPSVQEQILITLCNSAAFSVNHDIIRNLDGIRIIGGFLSDSNSKIKEKTLNALNNLSMNLQNQEQIKDFINDICKDITASPLNSEVQLAGLRLVINMSVTNIYHEKMADYIPGFLALLVGGNETTKIHTLKVLVNLSANPLMTAPLLTSKAPESLTSLFDSCINRDILIRALTFSANLSENLGREQHCTGNSQDDSLYGLLFGDSALFQRTLAPLSHHPDMEVKEQVSSFLRNSQRLTQL